jgi:hypothetical protein
MDHMRRVRPSSLWLPGAALMLGGCLGLSDDPDSGPPPPDDRIFVAVGAQVELEFGLGACGLGVDDVARGCLSEIPDALLEVSLSNERVFTVAEAALDGSEIHVETKAVAEGGATLTVRYLDLGGEEIVDEFELRAAELTRTEMIVPCREEVAVDEPLRISSGAQFEVELVGYAGDRRLATGDLPLVLDAGGLGIDEAGVVTVPEAPGTHVVTLRGSGSAPTTFVAYGAEELGLTLDEETAIADREFVSAVRVIPQLGGAPACILDDGARAEVWIGAGDCAPALGDVALEGPVPVDLGDADVELPVRGRGRCEVRAAVEGGVPGTLTIEPRTPFGAGDPWDEVRLGTAPLEVALPEAHREVCDDVRSLSLGGCNILDVGGLPLPSIDCLRSWKWAITHRDADFGDAEGESNLVGAGLRSELHARIDYEVLLFDVRSYPPADVVAFASPAAGLVAYADGCVDEDHAAIVLEHDVAGTYDVRLSASNINRDDSVEVRVRDVAEVRFDTVATDVVTEADVTRAHVFTGVVTPLAPSYLDANGVVLGGWAPWIVSTDEPDARAAVDPARSELHTGNLPNVIRVASSVAPSVLELDVVDGDAVATVVGIGEPTLALGEVECIAPVALAADQRTIHGRSAEPPRLTMTGRALVVEPDGAWPMHALCFRAWAVGQSTLEVRWGAVTQVLTWTVE